LAVTAAASRRPGQTQMKYDVADFADDVTCCCGFKLRMSVFIMSMFYASIALAQSFVEVIVADKLYDLSEPGHAVSTALTCGMFLASVSGFVGAYWRVEYPLSLCAFVVLCMMILNIARLFTTMYDKNKGWKGLEDEGGLRLASILAGSRPAAVPAVNHLLRELVAVGGHCLALLAAGGYALELRRLQHAVWFDLIESDEEEESAPLLKATPPGGGSPAEAVAEDRCADGVGAGGACSPRFWRPSPARRARPVAARALRAAGGQGACAV